MKSQPPQSDSAHSSQATHGEQEGLLAQKGTIIHAIRQHPLFFEAATVIIAVLLIAGFLYWQDFQSKVYIEKAEISAPAISLGPKTPGILEKVYVQEGDRVSRGQRLALVDNQTIVAKTNGIVINVMNTPGEMVTSQDAVVKIIDPIQFRVVGRLQEDKGLKDVKPGQRVIFTVDAFGSKQYEGTVVSVGMTSRQSDIVFSISDKREPKEFEVSALFDSNAYSELRNGMSAKMWVYK